MCFFIWILSSKATHDYQCFALDMNKLDIIYDQLTPSIKVELKKVLTEESPLDRNRKNHLQLIDEKLYTPQGGCFLV